MSGVQIITAEQGGDLAEIELFLRFLLFLVGWLCFFFEATVIIIALAIKVAELINSDVAIGLLGWFLWKIWSPFEGFVTLTKVSKCFLPLCSRFIILDIKSPVDYIFPILCHTPHYQECHWPHTSHCC